MMLYKPLPHTTRRAFRKAAFRAVLIEGVQMGRPFDIFRVDRNGSLVWYAATYSLDKARATIEQFSKIERGVEFVILNRETKEQITVTPTLLSHTKHTSVG